MNEQRRYTVAEVDAMRRACRNKCIWDRYSGPVFNERGYASAQGYDKHKEVAMVEEMVRTHMLAGHTAEDLIASEKPNPQRGEEGR